MRFAVFVDKECAEGNHNSGGYGNGYQCGG